MKTKEIKKLTQDQPWKKTQETLKQVESNEPKTDTLKKSKTERNVWLEVQSRYSLAGEIVGSGDKSLKMLFQTKHRN